MCIILLGQRIHISKTSSQSRMCIPDFWIPFLLDFILRNPLDSGRSHQNAIIPGQDYFFPESSGIQNPFGIRREGSIKYGYSVPRVTNIQ